MQSTRQNRGPLRMSAHLMLAILMLWSIMSCDSASCTANCTCKPFDKTSWRVKCVSVDQVPTGIPSNTVILYLAGNSIESVHEDSFENLPSLKKIDLSRNLLQHIPKNTFRRLTALSILYLQNNFIRGGFHLPESLTVLNLQNNEASLGDLKVILRGLKRLRLLNADQNRRLGPVLTSDIFSGLVKMESISMDRCRLEQIESGSFLSMQNLTHIDLSNNLLSHIQPGALEGPGDQLIDLFINHNRLLTISEGTFKRFEKLSRCYLNGNSLKSVPDLTGLKVLINLDLSGNNITDVSRIGKCGIQSVMVLSLAENQIKRLPANVFHDFYMLGLLDLSFNKLQSIPDDVFTTSKRLFVLILSFNNISGISRRTFSGLKTLRTLLMIKSNLTFIPEDAFVETSLETLFLHGNGIKHIHRKAFNGLKHLTSLTLFDNPLRNLPDGLFDNTSSNIKVSITCNNLRKLPKQMHTSNIECASSTSFFYIVRQVGKWFYFERSLKRSGFVCLPCNGSTTEPRCLNCSLCRAGYYHDDNVCHPCPAGGFYQDKMKDVKTEGCKRCSVGTYVSVERHPGKRATDCWACPYGTLSSETAGYRACKCLQHFYRLDRFGSCTPCPAHGIVCENDTAVLAPNYFWKWNNQSKKSVYKSFVDTIHILGAGYNKTLSVFKGLLPKPIKCPYAGSCMGGIDAECHQGYRGDLCATCANGYYLRFHTCLKCPRLIVSIISSVVVIGIFVVVFLMVLWGDSRKTENDRTVADVIMSCFKIVIGFYQVIAGIFSALVKVQWPVTLISMEKYLKLVEGNILQFAPLSCIYPQLRMDQFLKFNLVLSLNVSILYLFFIFFFLKRRHIKNKQDIPCSEKLRAVSSLKKSCYRNIFLFLLASYPITSKTIIQILPLPGACVTHCFTDDKSSCISLLRADYSIQCFTARHKLYWPIAAFFSLYPLGFPLLMLILIYKYRESPPDKEITFGLKVFFENYKKKFWFWEITEMYRKLILISLISLSGSDSLTQIGLTVFVVSAFGVTYTLFRPINDKFEDRLQTFVLWVIFFDVCLGAIYRNHGIERNQEENNSVFVNVLFVILNASVLIFALAKAALYAKRFWKSAFLYVVGCLVLLPRGFASLRRRVAALMFTRSRRDSFQALRSLLL